MSAATILKHAATVLQVLTLVGFILVIAFDAIRLSRPTDWLGVLCFFLLPVLTQVLLCWFLRHPIIHVSSIIASCFILLFQVSDLFTRGGYVPAVLLTLPATVIVLFIGTAVFFIHHRLTRPAKRSRRVPTRSRLADHLNHPSDGPPAK